MAPKKLSESDKQEILDRYCHSDETTVTLAAEYGVSTSTISRILKQSLPEHTYDLLVQQKRYGTRPADQDMLPGLSGSLDETLDLEDEDDSDLTPSQRRQRKRPSAGSISAAQLAASAAHLSQLEFAPSAKRLDALEDGFEEDSFEEDGFEEDGFEEDEPVDDLEPLPAIQEASLVTSEEFAEDEDELDDDEELEDDLEDEDLEEDFEEDDLEDGNSSQDLADLESMQFSHTGKLQILPLTEASIPKTCYVVVDRSSELITRPLKDFTELGKAPDAETIQRTLPIFDNHRVAKRFLRRMQRVVKVPDGRIFQKVTPYLQAKGITHLLIDGQVYALQD